MNETINVLNQEYTKLNKKYNASRNQLNNLSRFLNSNILYKIKKIKKN